MIAFPYPMAKLGLAAASLAAVWLHGCHYGTNQEEGKRTALVQGYAVATAQAVAREDERTKLRTNAIIVAGEKYEKALEIRNRTIAVERQRMRDSAATSARVRSATTAPGCPDQTGGATRDELLRYGETIIGLVESASTNRSALEACLAAWPR